MKPAHRFLVAPEAVAGDRVHLSDAQTHQISHVLRLRRGAQLRVFDGVRPVDLVVELDNTSSGRVIGECPQAAEPRTRLALYPALLQRDKFEHVLQKLTELGVADILPLITARSLVREAPDPPRMLRWQAILREASEQCGRGRVPTLHPAQSFSQAIRRQPHDALRILAFEGERHADVRQALREKPTRVACFVGPEGGFSNDEVELARAQNLAVVSLGPRILRAETAAPLLAGLVLYELGDLSSEAP